MTERPITQHGLSGLPSTARIGTAAGMRQVKDKRYWMVCIFLWNNYIYFLFDSIFRVQFN